MMRRLLWLMAVGPLLLSLLTGCAASSRSIGGASPPRDDGQPRLEIPVEASATAPFASRSRQDAAALRTDDPARFYRVRPHVEQWFAVDAMARVITWASSQGSEVAIYYVSNTGSKVPVDVGGVERPLSAPDPSVLSGGNQVTKRYLRDDTEAPGAGWLVVVPRTYDNGPSVFGVMMSSGW